MESAMAIVKSLIIRALIIYFVTSFFRRPSTTTTTSNGQQTGIGAARNIFPNGTELSLYVYLSESEKHSNFIPSQLFWFKEKLVYGDWSSGPQFDGTYSFEKSLNITDNLRNNGSLYLHAYLTRYGESPNPKDKNYGQNYVLYVKKQLNR